MHIIACIFIVLEKVGERGIEIENINIVEKL